MIGSGQSHWVCGESTFRCDSSESRASEEMRRVHNRSIQICDEERKMTSKKDMACPRFPSRRLSRLFRCAGFEQAKTASMGKSGTDFSTTGMKSTQEA